MRHTGITGYGGVLALKKFINIIAVCGNTARKAIKEAFGHFTTTATVVIKLIGNLNIGILNTPNVFLAVFHLTYGAIHNLYLLSSLITEKKTVFTQKKSTQRRIKFTQFFHLIKLRYSTPSRNAISIDRNFPWNTIRLITEQKITVKFTHVHKISFIT